MLRWRCLESFDKKRQPESCRNRKHGLQLSFKNSSTAASTLRAGLPCSPLSSHFQRVLSSIPRSLATFFRESPRARRVARSLSPIDKVGSGSVGSYPRKRMIAGMNRSSGSARPRSQLRRLAFEQPISSATCRCKSLRSSRLLLRCSPTVPGSSG